MTDFFYEDEEGLEEAQSTFRQLADTQQRMGEIIELMPVGLFIHRDQTIVFANKESARMLGIDQEGLIGRHLFDFVEDAAASDLFLKFQELFQKDENLQLEDVRIRSTDGTERIVRITASRLPWEGTPVAQILLLDITELKEKENELFTISITDPLTVCFNRSYFAKVSGDLIAASRRLNECLALTILDVDHFKKINDTHGHAGGDQVLMNLVRICKAKLEQVYADAPDRAGAVFRLGGEEFALLLPGLGDSQAQALCDELREEIAAQGTFFEEAVIPMTVSMGHSQLQPGEGVDAFLRRADSALYHAKETGRNRVVAWRADLCLPPERARIARKDGKRPEEQE
ncbi:GGDEF domain-containing protein [Aestuariispira insulae]|uniref:diguanylate cyclase n=1 Tax=Aestuariispira insulae TaxID=1461337 RepID=A0A3D9HEU3_9PROT|nr:sensor domain-containing diguanylate cyclase [Aestuariispira insulae]RED47999.1 PAS domain S-box-containing protein/diguanylate cyclase (GGDEF)-like protein [Aestuariispira insulae]